MKTHITDSLQVIFALLITIGIATAMAAPVPPKQVARIHLVVKKVQIVVPVPKAVVPSPVAVTPTYTGNDLLMHEAGIADSDFVAANEVITIESHWNPYSIEPHTGACGIVQELPCGKSGCLDHTNDVCELSWANKYVYIRYGGWSNALTFHLANGWY